VNEPRFSSVQLASGLRLRYAEWGGGGGRPLVLLHGYLDSWFSFSSLMACMPAGRYHAYAPDQRGHGDSDRPNRGYSMDEYATDAVELLNALGLERATLVGHSMGTFIARRVAELHPERVDRLVLIDSAMSATNAATLEMLAAVRDVHDPIAAELVRDFQSTSTLSPLPVAFFDRIVEETLKLPARVWRSALDGLLAFDDLDELGRIAAPTLVLWGEQDAVFPGLDEQRQLAARIPHARLIAYPDTGHAPQWERPQRVADDIDVFLAAETAT